MKEFFISLICVFLVILKNVKSQSINVSSTSNGTIADLWSAILSPSQPTRFDLACGTFLLKNVTNPNSTVNEKLSIPLNATIWHTSPSPCSATIIWLNGTVMEISDANEIAFENIKFGMEKKSGLNLLQIEVHSSSTVIFQTCLFYGKLVINVQYVCGVEKV
jgi:hypothetical protein